MTGEAGGIRADSTAGAVESADDAVAPPAPSPSRGRGAVAEARQDNDNDNAGRPSNQKYKYHDLHDELYDEYDDAQLRDDGKRGDPGAGGYEREARGARGDENGDGDGISGLGIIGYVYVAGSPHHRHQSFHLCERDRILLASPSPTLES